MAQETILQGFQTLVAELNIPTAGGSDTFLLQNLSDRFRCVGGSVVIFDALGLIVDEATRRDIFTINILADSKNSITNAAVEARALNSILQNQNFEPFVFPRASNTLVTCAHEVVGAGISTAPFTIYVTFYVIPTDEVQS